MYNYYSTYGFDRNTQTTWQDGNNIYYENGQSIYPITQDDRFFGPFFAPFIVGGLAGTALGYGIANNNQINRPQCCPGPMMYPYPMYNQQYPNNTFTNSNNFYY